MIAMTAAPRFILPPSSSASAAWCCRRATSHRITRVTRLQRGNFFARLCVWKRCRNDTNMMMTIAKTQTLWIRQTDSYTIGLAQSEINVWVFAISIFRCMWLRIVLIIQPKHIFKGERSSWLLGAFCLETNMQLQVNVVTRTLLITCAAQISTLDFLSEIWHSTQLEWARHGVRLWSSKIFSPK